MAGDPEEIAEVVRRCGIHNAGDVALTALRAHFKRIRPAERVRLCRTWGDGLAEAEIDRIWEILDRRPTRAEYLEITALFREAVTYCEKRAREVR